MLRFTTCAATALLVVICLTSVESSEARRNPYLYALWKRDRVPGDAGSSQGERGQLPLTARPRAQQLARGARRFVQRFDFLDGHGLDAQPLATQMAGGAVLSDVQAAGADAMEYAPASLDLLLHPGRLGTAPAQNEGSVVVMPALAEAQFLFPAEHGAQAAAATHSADEPAYAARQLERFFGANPFASLFEKVSTIKVQKKAEADKRFKSVKDLVEKAVTRKKNFLETSLVVSEVAPAGSAGNSEYYTDVVDVGTILWTALREVAFGAGGENELNLLNNSLFRRSMLLGWCRYWRQQILRFRAGAPGAERMLARSPKTGKTVLNDGDQSAKAYSNVPLEFPKFFENYLKTYLVTHLRSFLKEFEAHETKASQGTAAVDARLAPVVISGEGVLLESRLEKHKNGRTEMELQELGVPGVTKEEYNRLECRSAVARGDAASGGMVRLVDRVECEATVSHRFREIVSELSPFVFNLHRDDFVLASPHDDQLMKKLITSAYALLKDASVVKKDADSGLTEEEKKRKRRVGFSAQEALLRKEDDDAGAQFGDGAQYKVSSVLEHVFNHYFAAAEDKPANQHGELKSAMAAGTSPSSKPGGAAKQGGDGGAGSSGDGANGAVGGGASPLQAPGPSADMDGQRGATNEKGVVELAPTQVEKGAGLDPYAENNNEFTLAFPYLLPADGADVEGVDDSAATVPGSRSSYVGSAIASDPSSEVLNYTEPCREFCSIKINGEEENMEECDFCGSSGICATNDTAMANSNGIALNTVPRCWHDSELKNQQRDTVVTNLGLRCSPVGSRVHCPARQRVCPAICGRGVCEKRDNYFSLRANRVISDAEPVCHAPAAALPADLSLLDARTNSGAGEQGVREGQRWGVLTVTVRASQLSQKDFDAWSPKVRHGVVSSQRGLRYFPPAGAKEAGATLDASRKTDELFAQPDPMFDRAATDESKKGFDNMKECTDAAYLHALNDPKQAANAPGNLREKDAYELLGLKKTGDAAFAAESVSFAAAAQAYGDLVLRCDPNNMRKKASRAEAKKHLQKFKEAFDTIKQQREQGGWWLRDRLTCASDDPLGANAFSDDGGAADEGDIDDDDDDDRDQDWAKEQEREMPRRFFEFDFSLHLAGRAGREVPKEVILKFEEVLYHFLNARLAAAGAHGLPAAARQELPSAELLFQRFYRAVPYERLERVPGASPPATVAVPSTALMLRRTASDVVVDDLSGLHPWHAAVAVAKALENDEVCLRLARPNTPKVDWLERPPTCFGISSRVCARSDARDADAHLMFAFRKAFFQSKRVKTGLPPAHSGAVAALVLHALADQGSAQDVFGKWFEEVFPDPEADGDGEVSDEAAAAAGNGLQQAIEGARESHLNALVAASSRPEVKLNADFLFSDTQNDLAYASMQRHQRKWYEETQRELGVLADDGYHAVDTALLALLHAEDEKTSTNKRIKKVKQVLPFPLRVKGDRSLARAQRMAILQKLIKSLENKSEIVGEPVPFPRTVALPPYAKDASIDTAAADVMKDVRRLKDGKKTKGAVGPEYDESKDELKAFLDGMFTNLDATGARQHTPMRTPAPDLRLDSFPLESDAAATQVEVDRAMVEVGGFVVTKAEVDSIANMRRDDRVEDSAALKALDAKQQLRVDVDVKSKLAHNIRLLLAMVREAHASGNEGAAISRVASRLRHNVELYFRAVLAFYQQKIKPILDGLMHGDTALDKREGKKLRRKLTELKHVDEYTFPENTKIEQMLSDPADERAERLREFERDIGFALALMDSLSEWVFAEHNLYIGFRARKYTGLLADADLEQTCKKAAARDQEQRESDQELRARNAAVVGELTGAATDASVSAVKTTQAPKRWREDPAYNPMAFAVQGYVVPFDLDEGVNDESGKAYRMYDLVEKEGGDVETRKIKIIRKLKNPKTGKEEIEYEQPFVEGSKVDTLMRVQRPENFSHNIKMMHGVDVIFQGKGSDMKDLTPKYRLHDVVIEAVDDDFTAEQKSLRKRFVEERLQANGGELVITHIDEVAIQEKLIQLKKQLIAQGLKSGDFGYYEFENAMDERVRELREKLRKEQLAEIQKQLDAAGMTIQARFESAGLTAAAASEVASARKKRMTVPIAKGAFIENSVQLNWQAPEPHRIRTRADADKYNAFFKQCMVKLGGSSAADVVGAGASSKKNSRLNGSAQEPLTRQGQLDEIRLLISQTQKFDANVLSRMLLKASAAAEGGTSVAGVDAHLKHAQEEAGAAPDVGKAETDFARITAKSLLGVMALEPADMSLFSVVTAAGGAAVGLPASAPVDVLPVLLADTRAAKSLAALASRTEQRRARAKLVLLKFLIVGAH